MAEFLTTNGISYQIENIIIDAKSKLILVSPFLQLSKTLFERLKDASNHDVKIKIIYGKDDLKPNEKNSLAELKNVELFYFQNLHAKCYFNESKMVITSMNMYEFSEKNNREMGVLIDAVNDKQLFDKAVSETLSIIQSSEITPLRKTERTYYNQKSSNLADTTNKNTEPPKMGYCIRCEARISYNPDRPYCGDCYSVWAQFKNPDYEENVCHCCGEFETTTMNKAFCYTCFKQFPYM